MKQLALGLWSNDLLAALCYWLPFAFCAIGYLIRTARNIAKDRRQRIAPGAYYMPTDTIGSLIGRAVITILPVGNVFAAVFDLAPDVLGRFIRWCRRVFDQPLVPDLTDGRERRQLKIDPTNSRD